MSALVGVPFGIGASLIAWWCLWRLLAPRGKFSSVICTNEGRSGMEYRVKFLNSSRRPIMEAEFKAFIFAPSATPYEGSHPLITVPIRESSYSVIGGNRRRPATDILSLPHRVLILRPDAMRPQDIGRLGMSNAVVSDQGLLDDVLKRDGARLTIVCLASDGYSGARRAIVSRTYRDLDVVVGTFNRGPSLEFVPPPQPL